MNLALHIGVLLPTLQNAARRYLEELQAHAAT